MVQAPFSGLEGLFVSLLLGLNTLLGVPLVPADLGGWQVMTPFDLEEQHPTFVAQSQVIPDACRQEPSAIVRFPMVIHGAHRIYADGILVHSFGDPSFLTARSFYGSPEVSCQSIANAALIEWQVVAYSRFFSRISKMPALESNHTISNVFQETFSSIAAGNLIIISLMSLVLFRNAVALREVYSFVASNLFFALYFIFCVPFSFGLSISMLKAHKIADFGLWLGGFFLFLTFYWLNIMSKKLLLIFSAHVGIGLFFVALGWSGDMVQFGTMLPMGAFFFTMIYMFFRVFNSAFKTSESIDQHTRVNLWQVLSLGSFIVMALSDALTITGIWHAPMLLPLGIVGSTVFLGLDLNRKILEIYSERDYLRLHLEDEVKRKTDELKAMQADLVASAKMAMLGTVSAGIAHEINNSLNYVRGALQPLEKIVVRAPDQASLVKAHPLIQVMKEGLQVTFDIMNNLRSYSGLNHAKVGEYEVAELLATVLKIIRTKIPPDIKIIQEVLPGVRIEVNGAGMNQVLMNLVINAIDAHHENPPQDSAPLRMSRHGEQGKYIKIKSEEVENKILISVEDNGPGIPDSIKDSIFDPFFTTKDVGSGMGLGLHICRSEVKRHGGMLTVQSKLGYGATFTIALPVPRVPQIREAQAA